MPLPDLFLERLKKITGASFDNTVKTFSETPRPSFRLHHQNANAEKVQTELKNAGFEIEPVKWQPGAFRLLNKDVRALQKTEAFKKNHIYIQSLASMLPVLALDIQPGQTVLDVCAAPGSKAGQIARLLNDSGSFTANEKIRPRFFKLKTNLDAQGYKNILFTQKPGEQFFKNKNHFDRILLDAPCSSEGRFSANDELSYQFWSPAKIKDMAFKQRALFKAAFLALKPSGIMVYATCTFAPEENEAILDWALGRTGGKMEMIDWKPPVKNWIPGIESWEGKAYSPEVKKACRILPDETMGGFFIALVRKKA